jgi:hypothetical protein
MDDALKIFSIYKNAMKRCGRDVSLPKTKDVTKTYMWRQLTQFSNTLDDLEIDVDSKFGVRIIKLIVKRAKDNKQLNRGASILNAKNAITQALDELELETNGEDKIIESIEEASLFLKKQQDKNDAVSCLLFRKKRRGYSNIVSWYESGKLPKVFVALSKGCSKAMSKLPEDERQMLPSDEDIITIRFKCLHRDSLSSRIKQLLRGDLASGGS